MKDFNVSDISVSNGSVVNVGSDNHVSNNPYSQISQFIEINWEQLNKNEDVILQKLAILQDQLASLQCAIQLKDRNRIMEIINESGQLIRDFLVSLGAGIVTNQFNM